MVSTAIPNEVSSCRDRVEVEVNRYQADRNPRLSPFRLPKLDVAFPEPSNRVDGWHNSDRCKQRGVYVLVGADGALLYIGKASNTKDMGDRLYRHFNQEKERFHEAAFIQFIVIPQDYAHEAPALEQFLISALKPRLNLVGNSSTRRQSQEAPS